MKSITFLTQEKGQAMAEMLLCIPLLMLLAAGMVQFSLLFLSKVHFEYACGETARAFNLGQISSEGFADSVWDQLQPYQKLFDKNSIQISVGESQSVLGGDETAQLSLLSRYVQGSIFNYGGQEWTVTIHCKVTPLFGVLFPNGVPFSTQLAVLRHPQ
jgi:Flp pilus assembly protein TadG